MKKLLICITSLAILISLSGCATFMGVSGRNITQITVEDQIISFRPKCPSCGHVDIENSAVVDKGDTYSCYYVCIECFEEYIIEIKR